MVCAGCALEFFSDAEDAGRISAGATTASVGGAFAFDRGASLTGPYGTAAATDATGNTSEFCSPMKLPTRVYLAFVVRRVPWLMVACDPVRHGTDVVTPAVRG
jgi:hypothetical protein